MARPQDRFNDPAIVLHWLIAGFILANLYLGLRYAGATGLARFTTLQLHKSVGFTVLALSLLRLAWRLFTPPPPFPATMKPWEKTAATGVHVLLYVIMIGLPLTGWVIVSASPTNIPTLLYKTLPFPFLGFVHALPMAVRRMLEDKVGDVHVFLAFSTMALLGLHIGAALKHQLVDRDEVLSQMLPIPGLRPRAPH